MDDTPNPTDQEPNVHKAAVRRNGYIVWAIIAGMLAVAIIVSTTIGFGPYEEMVRGARQPTLWEWLQLLVVPVVLALGALWFNKTQKDTELRIAERARAADREIAEKARAADREIAEVRQQQATLEAYYDRMTDLLLTHDLREKSEADAEELSIARARTLAVLRSLDSERKGQVVRFLYELKIIQLVKLHIADLHGANLFGANLQGANLHGANLYGANLHMANLQFAYLPMADLQEADLREVYLYQAYLYGANLQGANLQGAKLQEARLQKANLHGANLQEAILEGAEYDTETVWPINFNLQEAGVIFHILPK
jgi:uncharacterized protein YjbI with pentapeptide repeats